MNVFKIENKTVSVYPGMNAGAPMIYLHTFADEGEQVHRILTEKNHTNRTLVAISGLDWNHDMAPWDVSPVFKNNAPLTGGADAYLRLLTKEIMPEVEKQMAAKPAWRGLAGYSLAGLFAVYSIYHTDLFSAIASVSGSLWYPNIMDYLFSHNMKRVPDFMYFSLGDKEHKTRNPFLKTVRQNTMEAEEFYRSQGIKTVFQMNPGNHYQDPAARTAAGIAWLLSQ